MKYVGSKPRIVEENPRIPILVAKRKPRIIKTARYKLANNEGRLYCNFLHN